MADIELVIKIDEDIAQGIIDGERCEPSNIVRAFQATIADAIKHGTPLPKGHGDLVDVDALREDFKSSKKITFAERMKIACIVDHASKIIKADKEVQDEREKRTVHMGE